MACPTMRTLVLDNGSNSIKVGWADSQKCLHVQNAMMRSRDRRLWLGNTVDLCKDLTGLQYRRPIDRGQLYSWELEKAIWDWTWDTKEIVESVDTFKESALLLTETPGSLPSASTNTDQIIFEEYEFAKYRRVLPQVLAANATTPSSQGKMVIDLGFGATHAVPVLDRVNASANGTIRLGVAGKLLTNYLKETVSFRHYNMMEETAIMGRIKEQTCFTSLDFAADLVNWHESNLQRSYSKFALGYALPSTHEFPYGRVIEPLESALQAQKSGDEQVLVLENERFSIPEVLFDPKGHVGLDQAGVAELVAQSIHASPLDYQPLLWSNVIVAGGTANLPNFVERFTSELRKWAPSDIPLRVSTNPSGTSEETAWQGGKNLVNDDTFDMEGFLVSREEYFEQGPAHVARKFASSNKWRAPS